MADFNELIPEMRDWNNGAGIDIDSWIGCSGNFQLAVGYSRIFWPQFVEFENYVFREGFSVNSLREFERLHVGNRRGVESVFNHLHIADIQSHGCEDLTRERFVYLGRVLREIYEAKLAWQFPHRRFEVAFDDSFMDNLLDYQITFYQVS